MEWHGWYAGQWGDRYGDLRTDTNPSGTEFNHKIITILSSSLTSQMIIWLNSTYLQRSEAIDFTIALVPEVTTLIAPILHNKIVQVFNIESNVENMQSQDSYCSQVWVYREIFPDVVWVLIGLAMATSSLGFIMIGRYARDRRNTLLESIGLTSRMLILLSYDDILTRRQFSFKMLLFSTSVWFYVIFCYYTADLTARKSIQLKS